MIFRGVLRLYTALILTVTVVMSPFGTVAQAATGIPVNSVSVEGEGLSPIVTHTGKAPTGYTVTFRYWNPDAERVQIKGEWFFARPGALTQIAGTPEAPVVETQGLLPDDWKPGDIPIAYPNATAANWPVTDMTQDNEGVWTYTTPLPSGTFTYSFFVDCATADQSGCTPISDPRKAPWSDQNGSPLGSIQTSSQVFVPSDPNFNTVDYWWQGPAEQQGTLSHHTYSSPGHEAPANKNYFVPYTPPNYDPVRPEPYPTLYLSHGGGGNETDWTTQGALGNIMDNLIAIGEIEPMLVVMPNASGYPSSTFYEAYDRDLIDNIIPFIEENYNVSTKPKDRAFSGLSMGGIITNSLMLKYPEEFGYFGMMSGGLPPEYEVLSKEHTASLAGKGIFVGSGWQDPIHAVGFRTNHFGPARQVSSLINAGIPVTPVFINGGHEWYVWRILLKDFLTRVAFQPQPYSLNDLRGQHNVDQSAAAITVKLNGEEQHFSQPPVTVDGSVLVPLRDIFESVDADVTWEGSTKTVFVNKGEKNIELRLNQPVAYVNGNAVELSQPGMLINGKTMVPLDFIEIALDIEISWNKSAKTIAISTK
ncbi:stalk domain-containing protein [Paenibacillus sp. LHD-117]|uniref:stalk domain-containing protein n=1 Tax=Paenibacillus sp. LHD-117 TaxID=3071412 RepID=UPI0027E0BFCD|nr:stalk domain-containing protein [Paenibacillus sp. LHD-117]MDQ6417923.1 stalk domain-containing protein [Paenibacillus sp. LHD-117]